MWSVVERTALAEAEVEYQDFTSDQVWVKFPVNIGTIETFMRGPSEEKLQKLGLQTALDGASIVIWTTTPWTIPGNRAISYSSKITYGLYEVTAAPTGNWAKVGDRFVLADNLAVDVFKAAKVDLFEKRQSLTGRDLSHFACSHPLAVLGYSFPVPLLEGDHVTDDAGTGFVHTAPGHGREDFDIWMANARTLKNSLGDDFDTTIPFTVDADGFFTKEAPGFEGKRVIDDKGNKGDANEAVIKALISADALIARGRLKHQYPHSWRSKKPVIFRNTPQWFIAMDKAVLPRGDRPTPHPLPLPTRGSGTERSAPVAKSEALTSQGGSLSQGGASWGPRMSTGAVASEVPSPLVGEGQGGGAVRASAPAVGPHPSLSPSGNPDGERGSLREVALRAIKETEWVPKAGENRITGMIEAKPDWVLSRQRAWGVPITVFVHKETGEVLPNGSSERAEVSRTLIGRITSGIEAKGVEAWFEAGAADHFLEGLVPDPTEWEQVTDILDVWFESGSTHAFVLEDPKTFPRLASVKRQRDGGRDRIMYLEGSDQHRGWFHSSLLESAGTRGRAPFDVVLTHGFILDEKGEEKMSKSKGNTLSPQEVMKTSGADILRLWVASSDTTNDIRFGPSILQAAVDSYRKLRNSLRWMLGTLAHYDGARLDLAAAPELERLMQHSLAELDGAIRAAYAAYDYKKVVALLTHFLNTDLSAFYFDIRKDTLYCEPWSSAKRQAALATIEQIFCAVTQWLAPILPFTAEEAWLARYPSDHGSVHLETFPELPKAWRDDALAERWECIRRIRSVVTGALELERAAKRIGSSLEAAPVVYIDDAETAKALAGIDLAELCITSAARLVTGPIPADAFTLDGVAHVGVVPARAEGKKCERSWRIVADVGADPAFPTLSARDAKAVREFDARRGV
jgi:isoleucyl-tRNA synthetase